MKNTPVRQELVLIGGGHAHLQVLRQLAAKPLAGLQVTLISREIQVPYSGMLTGYIAGLYGWDDIHIDLAPLCAACNVNVIQGEVQKLDVPAQTIQMENRPDLHFDLLSINVGSAPGHLQLLKKPHPSVKPIGEFLPQLEALLKKSKDQGEADITLVGSGASGVELALMLEYRLRQEQAVRKHRITIVTAAEGCLVECEGRAGRQAAKALEQAGIELVTSFKVAKTQSNVLTSKDGRIVKYKDLFWATQALPQNWFRSSGLAVDQNGFLLIDKHLACIGLARVFAAGDATSMLNAVRPKSGVFATRQGVVLGRNLRRKLLGLSLRTYKPQKEALALINLGYKTTLAVRGRLSFQNKLAWYWKDWIDQRFMKKFTRINQRHHSGMKQANRTTTVAHYGNWTEPPPGFLYCGGCAAKLEASSLTRVLERLDLLSDDATGAGDDAAVTNFSANTRIVQSFDGFRAMLQDPYIVAQMTTVHALNDIYAMGAVPLNVLAWVTLPWARPQLMEEKLFQSMSGILSICQQDNIKIVGGHSSEGSELSIGLSVTGKVNDQLWQKNGLRIGDVLVLTRPVGAGVLFAANMAGRCRGRWLFAAIESLIKSQSQAASILRRCSVGGCTDISGFGLLGHAQEMAVASNCELVIKVNEVPFLEGSLACFSAGIESSLQASNEHIFRHVRLIKLTSSDSRVKALADPMTAGGLLASLPAGEAKKCVTQLRKAGYQSACIGEVIEGDRARIHLVVDQATVEPQG